MAKTVPRNFRCKKRKNLLCTIVDTFFHSSRSSDWMLRWTGESIPAASLLPLSSRQHDWRALWRAWRFRSRLRGRRPVHGQCQRPWLRRGVPASAPALHGSRPPAAGPLHGHSRHDEAPSSKPRGRACRNPALVFLRSATDRQAALGPTQHLQGLRGAGHPQPAATARAGINTRTHTRGLWASGSGRSGSTAARAHAGGELTPSNLAAWRWAYQWTGSIKEGGQEGRKKNESWLFSSLLFSSLFLLRRALFGQRLAVCRSKRTLELRKDSSFWFYTLKFWPFLKSF